MAVRPPVHGSRLAVGSLLAVALVTPSRARGDRVEGTKSTSMYERKHEILATRHHGRAELRVRRTIENGGGASGPLTSDARAFRLGSARNFLRGSPLASVKPPRL